MDQLKKLEKTVATWYKDVPHLPKSLTDWLADNVWWLVVIGVVLSIIGIVTIVPLLLFAFGLSAGVATTLGSTYAGYTTGFAGLWLGVLISVTALVVTTVLELAAITPLKNKAKTGWLLLFAVAVINFVFSVVGDLVTLNIFSLVLSVLWAAVWAYFLFEIRGHFGVKHSTEKKEKAKA